MRSPSRWRSRSSSSTCRGRARSWCGSRPRACAIRTSRSSTATGRGRCRWRWATRPPASSRRSGRGVADLARGDHVVCVFMPSCGHCGPAPRAGRRCASRGRRSNGAGTLLSGARRLHWRRHGREASPGRVGLRRLRHRVAPLAGEDRPGAAAGGGGAVRLCGADRRRCRGQHGPGPGRGVGGGDRPGRRRPVLAAGGGRRRGARDRRHRPRRRQARPSPASWAPPPR